MNKLEILTRNNTVSLTSDEDIIHGWENSWDGSKDSYKGTCRQGTIEVPYVEIEAIVYTPNYNG